MERVSIPGVVGFYSKPFNQKSNSIHSSSTSVHPQSFVEDKTHCNGEGDDCSGVNIQGSVEDNTGLDGEHTGGSDDCTDDRAPHHTQDCVEDKTCPDDEHTDDAISFSDDEDGWINPDNFEDACAEVGGVVEEKPVGVAVGCVTTDFAMQVLKKKASCF